MRLRDHALAVAVLGTLKDKVEAAYKTARKAAEGEFAEARKDGQTQQKVMLPDGTEVGLISIRGGGTTVRLDDAGGLFGWCQENDPGSIERYLAEGAAEAADVIALVAGRFPNLVKERVRSSARAAYEKQMAETGGYVISGDGEKAKLSTVSQGDPTGAFTYRAGPQAADAIVAAWLRGDLREIVGPLALPGGGDPDAG